MEDQEVRLKIKRGTIRTLTTRLLQSIEKELLKTEVDIEVLEELLGQLSVKETILSELDEEIEKGIVNLEELESEIEGTQSYLEQIITWKRRALKKVQGNEVRSNGPNSGEVSFNSEPRTRSTVKLPPLTIEKFNGDPITWQSFWSQFEAAIHENGNLTKAEKFNYLKSYLGGSAANAVRGFTLTSANYDSAIVLLSERFGRKDLVINAHMNKLLNLEPVKKSSDVEGLRRLYDACEIQIRSLDSMGIVTDTYGSLLIPILLKMVPEDIALNFSRNRDTDMDWKVMDLLKFIQREVESRERAMILAGPCAEPHNVKVTNERPESKPKPWRHGSQNHMKANIPSASALNATVENKCLYCDKVNLHNVNDCKELSVQERKDKLKKLGRCFVCLGRGHIARTCRAKQNACRLCNRYHHVSICNEQEKDKQVVLSSTMPKKGHPFVHDTVLLQTANALAESENKSVFIRCLLDGGSQKTFILEEVSRALNLPVIGEETISIHTFGTNVPINAKLRKVKLLLRNAMDSTQHVEVEALETPVVCAALVNVPGQDIRNAMDLKGLQLADLHTRKNEETFQLSVLIGADFYWKVVTGRVERLTEKLVALETIFGWCVQGPTTVSALTSTTPSTSVMKAIVGDETGSFQIEKFWELESLGIMEKPSAYSNSEEEALKLFESSVQYKDGRYEVRLPWKTESDIVNDNFQIAMKRLFVLEKRFKRDLMLYDRYNQVITDQQKEGIVEQVSNERDVKSIKNTYYLPHQAVIREEKDN